MTLITVGVAAFFLAATLVLYAAQDAILERRRVYRGLRTVQAIEIEPDALGRSQLASPFSQRVALPALRRVGRMAARFTPAGLLQRLSRELAYAGEPAGWDAERVVAVKFVAAAAAAGWALLVGLAAGAAPIKVLVLSALLAGVGFLAPDFVLTSRYKQRQEQIRLALADALDILSITVEAGLGFDAALTRVAREIQGPLGQELLRVLQEMQLGKSRADSFRDLSERTTVEELKSFVLAMIQADTFGISVAKVLQTQSRQIRIKRRQSAEERAQKVPVKILFPLLFCIFPALFVVLLGPAGINIYRALFNH